MANECCVCVCVCVKENGAYLQHKGNSLHLDGSGCGISDSGDILAEVGREGELLEAGHGVRDVRPTHVDTMRVAKSIGLHSQ